MVRRLMAPLALFALLFALVAGSAQGVAAATNYTCPNRVCTFSVPDSYSEVSTETSSLTLKDDNSGGVFNILIVADAPRGIVLGDVVDGAISEYAKSDGFSPASSGIRDEAVGGLSAKSFTYASYNRSGILVVHKAYFLLRNGVVFNLNFIVTPDNADAYIESANEILSSFQFS